MGEGPLGYTAPGPHSWEHIILSVRGLDVRLWGVTRHSQLTCSGAPSPYVWGPHGREGPHALPLGCSPCHSSCLAVEPLFQLRAPTSPVPGAPCTPVPARPVCSVYCTPGVWRAETELPCSPRPSLGGAPPTPLFRREGKGCEPLCFCLKIASVAAYSSSLSSLFWKGLSFAQINPLLQVGKLRLREGEELPKVTQLVR